jgi:hypothetical protein
MLSSTRGDALKRLPCAFRRSVRAASASALLRPVLPDRRRTLLSVSTSLEINAKKFPKPLLNAEKPATADGLSAIGKSRPV